MTKTTITINGRKYDAMTGMHVPENPVAAKPLAHHTPTSQPHISRLVNDVAPQCPSVTHVAPMQEVHPVHTAQTVHGAPQRSQTLLRQAVKKPALAPAHATPTRSPLISRFTPPAEAAPQPHKVAPPEEIAPPRIHPAVAKILQQHHVQNHAAPRLSGTDLKEQLIKERLAEVSEHPAKKEKKTNWLSRQPRLVTVLSSTLALLVLGGYLTYITLPSISLKVAASRAGVNASMPEYKPDGYSLDGPITYNPGEVIITYKSNTNDDSAYKITQKATNWDSQAVLDNYVTKQTDNYLTFQEKGITVYTFGSKAAWVNGGLLYTIDGNAGLSSDQILRVATSI